jgi:cholesterol oxidase
MTTEHFDTVIVGSGFGGSVMAYRLSEQGQSVCVLERGKPYPPGSFPRNPAGMSRNFWDPSSGLYGMFNIWSFKGIGALVSSGLGGGSLIYANVLLRKDEKWFVKEDITKAGYEYWPVTRQDLDPHYDRAEKMLNAQTYPFTHEPYIRTAKTQAMKDAAERLDLEWQLPPLAVTFANQGKPPVTGEPIDEPANLHDRTRYTCRLCGECDVGCNYGSKNTLDYNYLTAAKRNGADIRTLCDVIRLAPRAGGGYTIRYRMFDTSRSSKTDPAPVEKEVTADRLVLAAGTLGSTYLLLKNRDAFPGLSKRLGSRFCGNGDLLTFALRCEDGDAGSKRVRTLDPNYGPVITSAIRVGDAADGKGDIGRGFYIEDAGYPAFMSWLAEATQAPGVMRRTALFALGWLRERVRPRDPDLAGEISGLFGDCAMSSSSLPLLGMGRDIPDGNMTLKRGLLNVDWETRSSKDYFLHMRKTMQDMVGVWGGRHQDNLLWYFNRVITVHPLGGCPMGRTDAEGVVDSYGEVFNHPGLFVADGSMMPGPVGANPALTIAALADRFADNILAHAPKRTTQPGTQGAVP